MHCFWLPFIKWAEMIACALLYEMASKYDTPSSTWCHFDGKWTYRSLSDIFMRIFKHICYAEYYWNTKGTSTWGSLIGYNLVSSNRLIAEQWKFICCSFFDACCEEMWDLSKEKEGFEPSRRLTALMHFECIPFNRTWVLLRIGWRKWDGQSCTQRKNIIDYFLIRVNNRFWCSGWPWFCDAGERIRTSDLFITSEAHCQLCYTSKNKYSKNNNPFFRKSQVFLFNKEFF